MIATIPVAILTALHLLWNHPDREDQKAAVLGRTIQFKRLQQTLPRVPSGRRDTTNAPADPTPRARNRAGCRSLPAHRILPASSSATPDDDAPSVADIVRWSPYRQRVRADRSTRRAP